MAAISPNYLPGSKGIPRNRVVDKAWSAVRSKDRNSVFAGDERNKAYLIWAAGTYTARAIKMREAGL